MDDDSPGDGDELFNAPFQQILLGYISHLLRLTLDATKEEVESFLRVDHHSRLERFISDTTTHVLFIQKRYTTSVVDSVTKHEFVIVPELGAETAVCTTLAIIKTVPILSNETAIQNQVQILNLPKRKTSENSASVYEALHNLIRLAVSPYFDSLTDSDKVNGSAGIKAENVPPGIPLTRKKIAELELSLLHLQQNVEIPPIILSVHPVIQKTIQTALIAHKRVSINDFLDTDIFDDLATINAIQATTVVWRQQIKQITEKDRDIHSGSTTQEINFWLNLDQVLGDVEAQLKSEPVALTFDVLAAGKRLGVNAAMILQDTGLKDAREKVKSYNLLMRDFPINELLSAPSLEKAAYSIEQIFDHINRRLRTVPYPIARVIPLAEAITRDIETQLLIHLKGTRLMQLSYNNFEALMIEANMVFAAYDNKIKDFITTSRDVLRKRSEKFLVIKVNATHTKVQERLSYLRRFREGHEQLASTIANILAAHSTLSSTDSTIVEQITNLNANKDISDAYLALNHVDVLDISTEGTQAFNNAEKEYDERVAGVEMTIIDVLRERLDAAKTANAMFSIFASFNTLFVRPKIRGAIQEYQKQLIDGVKQDIGRLQEKFKVHYPNADGHLLSTLRDMPPTSGHIIWVRQIGRQLDLYMNKVETVLGNGWHLYAEGQKLHSDSMSFRKRLDVKPLYDQWLSETQERENVIRGSVLSVSHNRADGNKLLMKVNFEDRTISLFKEVRNLTHLGFNIPHQINTVAKLAKQVYPHAISIIDNIDTISRSSSSMQRLESLRDLVAGLHNQVQLHLRQIFQLKWEQFRDDSISSRKAAQSIAEWSKVTSNWQNKVEMLISIKSQLEAPFKALETCAFDFLAFSQQIETLQNLIDQIDQEEFSNIAHWVDQLNQRLQALLEKRLRDALLSWISEFQPEKTTDSLPKINEQIPKSISWRLILKNQVIHLDPPIDFASAVWHTEIAQLLENVTLLPQLSAHRHDASQNLGLHDSSKDCSSIAAKLADILKSASLVISSNTSLVRSYVQRWLQFQSLWDLQPAQVWALLGDDLSRWLQTLSELRKSRTTFDVNTTAHRFPRAVITFDQIQARVNAKYDSWQREIVAKFAIVITSQMRNFYNEISKVRSDLETSSLDASSTANAVAFVITVQNCKRRMAAWQDSLERYQQGQATLYRQRHHFSSEWLPIERLEGEWIALTDILQRKSKVLNNQIEFLQRNLEAEDQALRTESNSTIAAWMTERPIAGNLNPQHAIELLRKYQSTFSHLQEKFDLIAKAKDALVLGSQAISELENVIEEHQDLSAVWGVISKIWSALADIRETPWSSVVPRKIRVALENVSAMTKDVPVEMRQYAAFDQVQNKVQSLVKAHPILTDLRSEAVRDRHWISLHKALQISQRTHLNNLTVGAVWDLNLVGNEKIVRQVVLEAQNQFASEEFLRTLKESWLEYTLELVTYQNKCKVIRGWEELFAKLMDNLNSLSAMRHNPSYKILEDEATALEQKLTKAHLLFDVWIEVQRQWIYLEGIFTENADIKQLLPMETSRFTGINTDFLGIMRRVSKSPLVFNVINIVGAQQSVERLKDMLDKVQRALGEYLEQERANFPRFYFLGDEDLLDIIGNSSDVANMQRHLGKMFAGISGLVLNEERTSILGVTSKEDESLTLSEPVNLEKERVKDWMSALDHSIKATLSAVLPRAISTYLSLITQMANEKRADDILNYVQRYPAQISLLAAQCVWTTQTESLLSHNQAVQLQSLVDKHNELLRTISILVLRNLNNLARIALESLLGELIRQRDILLSLIRDNVQSPADFVWQYHMKFYFDSSSSNLHNVTAKVADTELIYGYEYLGAIDRLIQTPLTDRTYLTLTQALQNRLGGSPFGPAGTGKTETVKALGSSLGRFVLVFCCDNAFDYQAMGRIFVGLCQVGAWGCFDEFNRLEQGMLSAISQQIQTIQTGLMTSNNSEEITLVGRKIKLHDETGIFITMNPSYAGRSNLPDNLKKLFRSVAMTRPDKELIAQVTFYSQGYSCADKLARQTTSLFELCKSRLLPQAHYDFGLRALKSVLISCGRLKRSRLLAIKPETIIDYVWESEIVLQSIQETIMPKLVGNDTDVLSTCLSEVFPDIVLSKDHCTILRNEAIKVANASGLMLSEGFLLKLVQLYQLMKIHHGVMLVGSAGTGKTMTCDLLAKALQITERVEVVLYRIDAKVMSKESLYGQLDMTTREWSDGLFTSILRKIVDNTRGEASKIHWIVFDGDVDPDWVENMNSVLDDNRLLTLPNGERIVLPPNVQILFEVDSLQYATPATISRCGMVYFNDGHVGFEPRVSQFIHQLQTSSSLDPDEEESGTNADAVSNVQQILSETIRTHCGPDGLVSKALDLAMNLRHVMIFNESRALSSLFGLCRGIGREMLQYNRQHVGFGLSNEEIHAYSLSKLVLCIIWAFAGDTSIQQRTEYASTIQDISNVEMESFPAGSIIECDVSLPNSKWTPWASQVPTIGLEPSAVTAMNTVITTSDTLRHEAILFSWLQDRRPLILCGPPGSGKTMTLFNALKKVPNVETAALNFSSSTTPSLVLQTLEQHCEYKKTLKGIVMSPLHTHKQLVLFCDEINLPAVDKYNTQLVIALLRQMIEHNGFWRAHDHTWVTLERIQIVAACNPPSDAGRTLLPQRFLRHAPVVLVDYPARESLKQIYDTFITATLKYVPSLRGYHELLTDAMIELYIRSQGHFTTTQQPHYIYSPRELSRWVRGIAEAIQPLDSLSLEGLVRIWAYEAKRLFADRLVTLEEREWTSESIRDIALEYFPNIDEHEALSEPILYSDWLSKDYAPVGRDELRQYIRSRLRTFCEEELDTSFVPHDDVVEQVLQIDRVLKQPQGHLILIGTSGSGRTTLCRFAAWMNGITTFQLKIHRKYSSEDFDEDLRTILKRCGTKSEKMCLILDESNILSSGFLERMNTLLANAEIPGLFEGEDFNALMTNCKESALTNGLILDTSDELYLYFTQEVVRNLHVVFTMNPPSDISSKAATSPALFNRCVLNWFGTWTIFTMYQVAAELLDKLDIDRHDYEQPTTIQLLNKQGVSANSLTYRDVVVNALITFHIQTVSLNGNLSRRKVQSVCLTPRHFLALIHHTTSLYNGKRRDLEDQQRHVNIGLSKLHDTVVQVDELQKSLTSKREQLNMKNIQANNKLQSMVSNQQEAEKKRVASLEIQEAITIQEREILARRTIVVADLAQAEPAVLEAQQAVSNIKKQQLTEVRSMANPPEAVKLAMESVCTLLGHQVDGWRSVQSIIRREDFISSIVRFDSESQMTPTLRKVMQRDYMMKPMFQFEAVNRASKACGPLVQWVVAQVSYSEILDQVGPLRQEVADLEAKAILAKKRAKAMNEMIDELEESIAQYKVEYAELIAGTQAIKIETVQVEQKVLRSTKLLDSLTSEKSRWIESSRTFKAQLHTLVGNVVLSAAYMTYACMFDLSARRSLRDKWAECLTDSGIAYDLDYSAGHYLSNADERVQWEECGLPSDDLCIENAVVLRDHDRYPLIIDPSGRAVSFLAQEHRALKPVITSFLDNSFIKHLESALRFGGIILINDAEYMDPIMNKILDREYQKTGGRVLVQLGKTEVDVSPKFRLYMATRNSKVEFDANVCSRVTFVNFTITKATLTNQSLAAILRSQRPEVDRKRTTLIKIKGEFQSRLRKLEKDLLAALNASQGSILDDHTVIETLEYLKTESKEVSEKVLETEGVMQELAAVTQVFEPIGQLCSLVFTIIDNLADFNHFYRFSLEYFENLLNTVLRDAHQQCRDQGEETTIDYISNRLVQVVFSAASQSMLHADQIVLAVLLRITNIETIQSSSVWQAIIDTTVIGRDTSDWTLEALGAYSTELKSKPQIAELSDTNWTLQCSDDESLYQTSDATQINQTDALQQAALMSILRAKLFRHDTLICKMEQFVSKLSPVQILDETDHDLKNLVLEQITATTPIMLCSASGFDASFKVDALTSTLRVHSTSVAMGSADSVYLAERAIDSAARSGSWVLLKNVHLDIPWLATLEKRVQALNSHENFRLFLTLETSPNVPPSLIRICRVLMFESPPGLRANMIDASKSIPSQPSPKETARLFFLLMWLHAIVQERLRYPGIGWTKLYDFNDSDLVLARSIIDSYMSTVAGGRANIAPEKIPWQAIRTLLKESVYGGRIDEAADQKTLNTLVEKIFTPAAFDPAYRLVDVDEEHVQVPDVTTLPQFIDWMHTLPEREPPTWLGLQKDAQSRMMANEGDRVLAAIKSITAKVQETSDT